MWAKWEKLKKLLRYANKDNTHADFGTSMQENRNSNNLKCILIIQKSRKLKRQFLNMHIHFSSQFSNEEAKHLQDELYTKFEPLGIAKYNIQPWIVCESDELMKMYYHENIENILEDLNV